MTAPHALADFLRTAIGYHGPWNCSTDAADWCVALGHPDFAAEWRETLAPAECEAAPAEAGGLAILWDRGIGESLPVATAPFVAGDIGVISLHGLETGGIFTGERWAIRAAKGIHFAALPDSAIIAGWRPWAKP